MKETIYAYLFVVAAVLVVGCLLWPQAPLLKQHQQMQFGVKP
jgi:hypothetical protein